MLHPLSRGLKGLAVMLFVVAGVAPAFAQDSAAVPEVVEKVPAAIKEAGKLRIAMPDQGKPFAYKVGNELKGMDVDLANALAATMGLEAEVTLIPFASALTGLQANKFDISFGEFYITAERMKTADFITSWQTYATFLVNKDKGFMPATVSDVCGKSVAVMTGSVDQVALEKAKNDCADGTRIKVEAFPNSSSAVLALVSGRVDAVRADIGVASDMMRATPGLVNTGKLGGGFCAIAVARNENSTQMLDASKAALDHLIKSGEYRRILEKNETAYGAIEEAAIYAEGSNPPVYKEE
ncbi:transporter substrate-binding domain-containing protein [Sinorhizobium mexicanum]|uniref:Transporter substrate-binding domain-containing protein n=1 Tax=Sinorhizobium mexicanum TaxID=375549 RepID=A0A859QI17_9HYPH|nr:transporter substrate-binding domain-containing protein [Sinorhizobium mexicanum]MBP1881762.1 polar amino acid transport system substrate-binding protein [Sinorhizobium mexicanum]QLL61520.1 transporter substrate-binding domain-containing protein [Sinorhizobium mexicanum]